MLVLSRSLGDRVRLTLPDGSEIWVVVTRVERGKVRLGFQAAAAVVIEREEVIKRRKGDAGDGNAVG